MGGKGANVELGLEKPRVSRFVCDLCSSLLGEVPFFFIKKNYEGGRKREVESWSTSTRIRHQAILITLRAQHIVPMIPERLLHIQFLLLRKQERGKRLRGLKDGSPQFFGDAVAGDLEEARCETGVSDGVDDGLAVREGRVER